MTISLVGTDVAAAIDRLIDRPVLVTGSLPPAGHDLDLLARRAEQDAIQAWLADNGFLPWDGRWARTTGDVFNVDLVAGLPWSSDFDESRLYIEAEPLPGYTNLCQPSPGVQLVMAARSFIRHRWQLTSKNRGRVERALARDPEAWSTAAELARSCGAGGALSALRASYERTGAASPLDRVAGAWRTVSAGGPLRTRMRLVQEASRTPALPVLITFSGLDGSGKSTQVARLSATMRKLGLPTATRRAGLRKGHSIREALPVLDRRPKGTTDEDVDTLMPSVLARTAVGRQAWVGVLALANVAHGWRVLLTERRARLVVVDRYAADAAVKFELYYRIRRATAPWLQQRLLSTLMPRPLVAFHIDVPVETALARRPEEDPEKITGMGPLYATVAAEFDLVRLDGQRDPDDLADEIATTVWQELSRRPRS